MAPASEVTMWQSSRFDPKKNCAASIYGDEPQSLTLAGIETVAGIQTYKLVDPRPLAGARTACRAPALGCITLKRIYEFADNNSRSSLDVVSVSYGEPSAAMFEPEPSYEELSPLAMESKRLANKFPNLSDVQRAHRLKQFERFEAVYTRYHVK